MYFSLTLTCDGTEGGLDADLTWLRASYLGLSALFKTIMLLKTKNAQRKHMPHAFVHGTPFITASFTAGPAAPNINDNHLSHVSFSRYWIPSLGSSVSLYLSRIVTSTASVTGSRYIRKSRDVSTRRRMKTSASAAQRIGELRRYVR